MSTPKIHEVGERNEGFYRKRLLADGVNAKYRLSKAHLAAYSFGEDI